MKRILLTLANSLLISICSATSIAITDDFSLEPSMRWRYQDIQNDVLNDATANTLKLRLSADWQARDNVSIFAQADHVQAIDERAYSSITIGRNTAAIPDPAGSEVNQLFIRYDSQANWTLSLGRLGLNFDNQRHISQLEFWQNDQTYDALSFAYQDNIRWSFDYAYVSKVHRIFGDDAKSILSEEDVRFLRDPIRPTQELGNHEHQTHLFNARYQPNRTLTLGAFAYLIDNSSRAQFSSSTYGLRVSGDAKPNNIKYSYTAEYAIQKNAGDSPWQYSTDYYLLEAAAQYKSHQLIFSAERVGSDNGFAFATSLGDNHKFFGWVDIFSSYQATSGLKDLYLTYRGRSGKLRWRTIAHRFSNQAGRHIGDELDIEIAYRYNREWEFTVVAAFYLADEGLPTLPSSLTDVSTWFIAVAYNL